MIGNFTDQQTEALLEWVSFGSELKSLLVRESRILHRVYKRKSIGEFTAYK